MANIQTQVNEIIHEAVSQVCPIEGIAVRTRDVLSEELALRDFRIDFAPEATNDERRQARNRIEAFIGWTPQERRDWLEARLIKTPEQRIAELEARLDALEARVTLLEGGA